MDYPKTRMDNFYAKAAGSDMADMSMKPITDREYWINELAARLAEGGLVPPIEEGDDGKVLTVDEGAAVWAEGGGGSYDPYAGYDWVIKHDSLSYTESPSEYHVVKGDYNTLCEIGNQKLPIKLLFYSASDGELWHTVQSFTGSPVFYTDYDDYGDDVPFIRTTVFTDGPVIIIKYTSSGLNIVFD